MDIIKELINKSPEWVFSIFGVMLLVFVGLIFYLIIYSSFGMKKLIDKISNSSALSNELFYTIMKEKESVSTYQNLFSIYKTSSQNIRSIINSYLEINKNHNEFYNSEISQLLQRCIDLLASEVKLKGGDLHRCGLWMNFKNDALQLTIGSSGFPRDYIETRELKINDSVAGRSFRKGEILNIDNVRNESDYQIHEGSKSQYNSLICIPIGEFSVLTLDGKQPFGEDAQILCELYASVIELILHNLLLEDNAVQVIDSDLTEINENVG